MIKEKFDMIYLFLDHRKFRFLMQSLVNNELNFTLENLGTKFTGTKFFKRLDSYSVFTWVDRFLVKRSESTEKPRDYLPRPDRFEYAPVNRYGTRTTLSRFHTG